MAFHQKTSSSNPYFVFSIPWYVQELHHPWIQTIHKLNWPNLGLRALYGKAGTQCLIWTISASNHQLFQTLEVKSQRNSGLKESCTPFHLLCWNSVVSGQSKKISPVPSWISHPRKSSILSGPWCLTPVPTFWLYLPQALPQLRWLCLLHRCRARRNLVSRIWGTQKGLYGSYWTQD